MSYADVYRMLNNVNRDISNAQQSGKQKIEELNKLRQPQTVQQKIVYRKLMQNPAYRRKETARQQEIDKSQTFIESKIEELESVKGEVENQTNEISKYESYGFDVKQTSDGGYNIIPPDFTQAEIDMISNVNVEGALSSYNQRTGLNLNPKDLSLPEVYTWDEYQAANAGHGYTRDDYNKYVSDVYTTAIKGEEITIPDNYGLMVSFGNVPAPFYRMPDLNKQPGETDYQYSRRTGMEFVPVTPEAQQQYFKEQFESLPKDVQDNLLENETYRLANQYTRATLVLTNPALQRRFEGKIKKYLDKGYSKQDAVWAAAQEIAREDLIEGENQQVQAYGRLSTPQRLYSQTLRATVGGLIGGVSLGTKAAEGVIWKAQGAFGVPSAHRSHFRVPGVKEAEQFQTQFYTPTVGVVSEAFAQIPKEAPGVGGLMGTTKEEREEIAKRREKYGKFYWEASVGEIGAMIALYEVGGRVGAFKSAVTARAATSLFTKFPKWEVPIVKTSSFVKTVTNPFALGRYTFEKVTGAGRKSAYEFHTPATLAGREHFPLVEGSKALGKTTADIAMENFRKAAEARGTKIVQTIKQRTKRTSMYDFDISLRSTGKQIFGHEIAKRYRPLPPKKVTIVKPGKVLVTSATARRLTTPKLRPRPSALIVTERGVVTVSHEARRPSYQLPGGGKNLLETSKGSLKRELKEELGVKGKELEYVGEFPDYASLNQYKIFKTGVKGEIRPVGETKSISYYGEKITETALGDFQKTFNSIKSDPTLKHIVLDFDETLSGAGEFRPGAINFIKKLKAEGYVVSIWSHGSKARVVAALTKAGIKNQFKHIITRPKSGFVDRIAGMKDIRQIGGDVLIDNTYQQIANMKQIGKTGIQMEPFYGKGRYAFNVTETMKRMKGEEFISEKPFRPGLRERLLDWPSETFVGHGTTPEAPGMFVTLKGYLGTWPFGIGPKSSGKKTFGWRPTRRATIEFEVETVGKPVGKYADYVKYWTHDVKTPDVYITPKTMRAGFKQAEHEYEVPPGRFLKSKPIGYESNIPSTPVAGEGTWIKYKRTMANIKGYSDFYIVKGKIIPIRGQTLMPHGYKPIVTGAKVSTLDELSKKYTSDVEDIVRGEEYEPYYSKEYLGPRATVSTMVSQSRRYTKIKPSKPYYYTQQKKKPIIYPERQEQRPGRYRPYIQREIPKYPYPRYPYGKGITYPSIEIIPRGGQKLPSKQLKEKKVSKKVGKGFREREFYVRPLYEIAPSPIYPNIKASSQRVKSRGKPLKIKNYWRV